MNKFQLVSNYEPAGDQPQAINQLVDGLNRREKYQTLLGVTGSGKTFTISNVIQAVNKPTLIISHNKTLAAQLYSEFKAFFPNNAVEFFISYYDYYQPEAYVVKSDLYIEKDFSINEEIDRLRLKATTSLIEGRRDVIVVASVSCIYGIGAPQEYANQILFLKKGEKIARKKLLRNLIDIHYVRNDVEFSRGTFRARGDVIEIIPAYQNEEALRIEFWDDDIEKLSIIDSATGQTIKEVESSAVYPAKYFVSNRDQIQKAIHNIELELRDRLEYFRSQEKYLEAQRIEQRTRFDIEMMKEIGYCSGIENYSRHMDGRTAGSRPYNLLDYFPKDFLLVIDESHVTVPQIRGMYNGDRSRKETLVEYGFRLPSALDNRPMKFEEFESMLDQVIFVSATPADFELQKSGGVVVEQIIRPTGLLDPDIEVRPIKGQIDDLIGEIRERSLKKERVLVTTLTKKMSEDLADYLDKIGILVRYIHSDIDSLERVEILRDLRLGDFDVLVGVNLLREGLDLPEVSLVAIIDADKEGFLRSERSLMQTAGRTARNVNGKVIMYADVITESMRKTIAETNRRRKLQKQYNHENNITPTTIYKSVEEILSSTSIADIRKKEEKESFTFLKVAEPVLKYMSTDQKKDLVEQLTEQMYQAAKDLEFERAASIRDEISHLKKTIK
ncbi:MAG: excinuclease ABC subunit B [Ignavibacteria bacterium RIFOXYB2_FULL_35_12]|nr:MAG: excinuclease ABC subunit B [Ignavibacteria bacterium GWA2_36_19]OGU57231.1 MAG: excinuclease ABC subunit B [Ignavibacteria bacterium GWF2_35_20]OGU79554.1 MAG: excinuclease ABC subunit B [Ignavibacteria bacterium RIFOXYA2_FULL_35_9]OGU85996.1 MAG: excinuclease ABC subunit B [Ignavibacteria bacterium RIFOXYA12_FULL_35_25]OGU91047.1 MAG: excinuclease ABC subunit B [Ignavibacteria bacterium RIFOXYC12_FULL_35_11]OGU97120.1 MAG: excinuclease ABC subunit B [Ignavibacteria bacterium RIFOXYB12